ncbi:type II secretion system major pseudopilin GspG [bacterium]|nr:type II secretion system major pseudopilin GspG [bacterium]
MKQLKSQAGMTLIEIMVVVAIIAGITGLIAVNVLGQREKANLELTSTQISNIMSALDQYKLDNHKYPSSEQGLEALVKKPSSGTVPKYYPEGGYLKKMPKDAWGNDFSYASPGTHGEAVEIWSSGPDSEPDTEDDVKSWDMEAKEE